MTIPVLALVSGITDIASGGVVRCYQNVIPQGVAMPAVRWAVIWGNPEAYLSEAVTLDSIGVQVEVYVEGEDKAADANRIGRVVLAACENGGQNVCVGNMRSGYEEETKRHYYGFDMEFWLSR